MPAAQAFLRCVCQVASSSSVGDLRLLIQRELPTSVGAVIGTRHRTNEGWLVGLAVCGAGVDQDSVAVVHFDETHIANIVCAPRWRFGERGNHHVRSIAIPFARTISAFGSMSSP